MSVIGQTSCIARRFRALLVTGAIVVALVGCSEDDSGQMSLTATPAPTPIDDELQAAEDNGALGRNNFGDPAHVAPVQACADQLTATDQSLVIRVLPRGPLAPNGSLAFTSGVCIYLPPGYVQSGLRYPVLYLLHGGGGDAADWVTFGGIRSIMDNVVAADPANAAIVVMPDGTDAQWYDSLDGAIKNEQYVLSFLIPYIDRHFRTIPTRAGRAIDGLSNGGFGTMLFAAKAPDRFVAAGGMSSNLSGLSFTGLGDPDTAYQHGNLPVDLAGNLDGVDLTMDIGTLCISDRTRDHCFAWAFEKLFVPANRAFRDQVTALRKAGDGAFDYREGEGGHAWVWWTLWMRERHLPFLLARLSDPRPSGAPVDSPGSLRPGFRYRSIAPAFSVWGYDVRIERAVREFLDLTDVRADGLAIQGSGRATIRTASLYRRGTSYVVSGAGGADQQVVADGDGRITFAIDLGVSHEHDQYTAEANALEATGGYWTERTVAITEG